MSLSERLLKVAHNGITVIGTGQLTLTAGQRKLAREIAVCLPALAAAMGVLGLFSYGSKAQTEKVLSEKRQEDRPISSSAESNVTPAADDSAPSASTNSSIDAEHVQPENIPLPMSPTELATDAAAPADRPKSEPRRFSFKAFSFSQKTEEEHKHVLSAVQEREKKAHVSAAFSKRLAQPLTGNSNKRAKESALVLRSLIVGPSSAASPKMTTAIAKPQLSKIKSEVRGLRTHLDLC